MATTEKKYDPATERVFAGCAVANAIHSPMDWVRLALACLDQAGLDIGAQRDIERRVLLSLPELPDDQRAEAKPVKRPRKMPWPSRAT